MGECLIALVCHVALSAQLGVLVPAAPYAPAPVVLGSFEVALSPHVSIRPSVLWAEPRAADASLRRVGLHWDAIVRWDRRRWSPFATVGVGMELFQAKVRRRAVSEDDELNFGGAIGGGLEVRLWGKTAVTGELTWFVIEQGRLPQSPSAFGVRGGLKQYF